MTEDLRLLRFARNDERNLPCPSLEKRGNLLLHERASLLLRAVLDRLERRAVLFDHRARALKEDAFLYYKGRRLYLSGHLSGGPELYPHGRVELSLYHARYHGGRDPDLSLYVPALTHDQRAGRR